jgi:cytochrome c-type biogenesis protein CcmH/NrfG
MRAMWHFSQLAPEHHEQAATVLRQAIKLDADLAQAHMMLARVLVGRVMYGWSSAPEKDLSEAHAEAARSVLLDDRDPYAHYAFGWTSLLRLMHTQALAEAQRSIDLNPNFALGFFALGLVRIHIGHFRETIDSLLRSLRLNPNDPRPAAS